MQTRHDSRTQAHESLGWSVESKFGMVGSSHWCCGRIAHRQKQIDSDEAFDEIRQEVSLVCVECRFRRFPQLHIAMAAVSQQDVRLGFRYQK